MTVWKVVHLALFGHTNACWRHRLEILVEDGEEVKAGQILMQLDAEPTNNASITKREPGT